MLRQDPKLQGVPPSPHTTTVSQQLLLFSDHSLHAARLIIHLMRAMQPAFMYISPLFISWAPAFPPHFPVHRHDTPLAIVCGARCLQSHCCPHPPRKPSAAPQLLIESPLYLSHLEPTLHGPCIPHIFLRNYIFQDELLCLSAVKSAGVCWLFGLAQARTNTDFHPCSSQSCLEL
ncbi:hypothetical protein F7725_018790 [Dissostichus mawsoni]|uniref:Uncharacterized protein n=1 Tax=Dissostichus mawsoni TaxID=36200 RepID=A0A7J5XTE1_DISMA|nr:hypothetical protein F7725_018790 [Dissostichus mawsoni]